MCPNKEFSPQEKGVMDFNLFRKIIDEAKEFCQDVYLHHRGEPLIAPNFAEMIKYARHSGLKVKFHTNASLLTEERAVQILDAAPDLISFSFDGFSKDIYEKIRVGSNFEKTVENISRFLQLKREKGKKKPYTIIEEIEFPQYKEFYNEKAKQAFSDKFRKLGLDELIFKKLYNWAGSVDVEEEEVEKGYTMCTFIWYSAVILWDGTVTPCPQDFFGKIKLGNVSKDSLKNIWNDKPYQELRQLMATSVKDFSPCNQCDRLWRKKIGGLPIQYMISFLNDQIVGYGSIRKLLGSYERNE